MPQSLLRGVLVACLLPFLAVPALAQSYLYWGDSGAGAVGRANIDGTGSNSSFITGGSSTMDAVVDANYVYWANYDSGTIGRANLDGTGADQNFITGGSGVRSVRTDGTYLYWTNMNTGAIGRANLDGTGVDHSFISGLSMPTGIEVGGTYIYWTSVGDGTVGRALLDGTGADASFITGGSGIDGLAVDASYLYWANQGSGAIGRANLDGTGVDHSFITGATGPYGVGADDAYVYWTNAGAIGRANLDGTGVDYAFITGLGDTWGLFVPGSGGGAPAACEGAAPAWDGDISTGGDTNRYLRVTAACGFATVEFWNTNNLQLDGAFTSSDGGTSFSAASDYSFYTTGSCTVAEPGLSDCLGYSFTGTEGDEVDELWIRVSPQTPGNPSRFFLAMTDTEDVTTNIDPVLEAVAHDVLPEAVTLESAYPNPFNPTTRVAFSLPQPGAAHLAVYDLLGREVTVLATGQMDAGRFEVTWNGRDAAGLSVPSGVYLVRLQAAGHVRTQSVTLIK